MKNRNVEVETSKEDKYHRKIAKVTLDNGLDYGSYMIKNGFAIVRYISTIKNNYFYYYDTDYVNNLYDLQDYAKKNKKGFWSESEATLRKIFPS